MHSYTPSLPGWSISLDASGIKHFAEVSYCLRRFFFFFQLAGGMQHDKITLTSFFRTSWHGFAVIKRVKSILFDVLPRHYDTAKWMRWKSNVKFRSVPGIRRTRSFNVLKITTLKAWQRYVWYLKATKWQRSDESVWIIQISWKRLFETDRVKASEEFGSAKINLANFQAKQSGRF